MAFAMKYSKHWILLLTGSATRSVLCPPILSNRSPCAVGSCRLLNLRIVLEKEYEDPIAHFREVAKKMTEEENARRKVTITFDMNEELSAEYDGRKNLGYAAILKIYYELELDRFLYNDTRHKGFEYNANSIMTLLVVSRLLSPGSKLRAYERRC